MRNVPPPYFAARYGKRHIFPKPTAEAAAAKINAHLPDHDERDPVFIDAILFPFPIKSASKSVAQADALQFGQFYLNVTHSRTREGYSASPFRPDAISQMRKGRSIGPSKWEETRRCALHMANFCVIS